MKDVLIGTQVWYGNKNIDFSKLNFDFLEIDLETLKPEEAELINLHKKIAFHAPHSIKFSHIYENIENIMLKEQKRIAEFAFKKKACYVNYHFNFPFYGFKDLDAKLKQRAKENTLSLLKEMCKKEMITFENLNKNIFSSEDIFSFLVSNGAKICFDTGHFALEIFEKEKTLKNYYFYLEKFIEKFGKHVKVIHLHNVALNRENRLTDHTLNGFLDIFKVLEVLKSYEVNFINLEIFSINAERLPFDYRIIDNFAERIRKVI